MNDVHANSIPETTLEGEHGPRVRRVYVTPTLRRLGSVRELTFGSKVLFADTVGVGGKVAAM